MENVKKPVEAGMFCKFKGETFHSFIKNLWIGNSGPSCNMANNDTGLYDITNINKLVQRSSGNMSAMRKGKLCMIVCQVNGSKKLYVLWSVKHFTKADANHILSNIQTLSRKINYK